MEEGNLFGIKPFNKIKETRELNPQNGNDAEIYASSKLLMAIGGEISWGSRNEDSRKIDLICSYDHPWYEKERIVFFVQVKSGAKYGTNLGEKGFLLKFEAIKMAQRTSHSICLVWVDRAKRESYWAYIHPNSLSKSQEYKNNHQVLPAMRYDIARCMAKSMQRHRGASGIIIKEINIKNDLMLRECRRKALLKYKDLQNSKIISPNLGEIEFTRIGWRHMFRNNRQSKNKEQSFVVINYLDKILKNKPNEIYVSNTIFDAENDYSYRTCEYVLVYEKIPLQDKNGNKKDTNIIIRLKEQIRWPNDWSERTALSQFVERKVLFLSCHYKIISD